MRRGFTALVLLFALGATVATAADGRMKAMRIQPVLNHHPPLKIFVEGPFRAGGVDHVAPRTELPLPQQDGLSLATEQFVIGDTDGVVSIRATPAGPGEVLLANVRPRAGLPYAHHSWLTLYPPVDDPAAIARKAAFDRGEWRIPGKDFHVGLPLGLRPENLTDLADVTRRQPAGSWDERGSYRFDKVTPPVRLREFKLAGAGIYLNGSPGLSFDRFQLDLQGKLFGFQQPMNAEGASPRVSLSNCTITDSLARTPGWTGNLNGVYLPAGANIRRCLIENTQNGVQAPGPGLYEDLYIRHNGLRDGDHGASWMSFPMKPFVNKDGYAGHYRLSGFHFEMPAQSSPRWDGTITTAAISIWNSSRDGYGLEDIVIERGLIDGGAFPIVIEPYVRTEAGQPVLPIRNIVIRDVWFTRHFEYQQATRVIAFHDAVANFGPNWSNITACRLYWADTGEEIADAIGVWNPGPNGAPVRSAVVPIDRVTRRATGC